MNPLLQRIRDAVLNCAKAGVPPNEVALLTLKISSEVAISTGVANREVWLSIAEAIWDRSQEEHLERIAGSTSTPGDA